MRPAPPPDQPAGPRGREALRWWFRLFGDPLGAITALTRKYGDEVRVPYAPRRAVYLLSRPEHAEQVLVADQRHYVKARTYRPLRSVLRDGLLTSEGEKWQQHRRLVQPVFAQRHLGPFAPAMAAATAEVCEGWAPTGTVDVAAEMREVTLEIVGRALFGTSLGDRGAETGRSLATVQREALRTGMLMTLLPGWLDRRMPGLVRRLPRLGPAIGQLEALVEDVITRRLETGPAEPPADLLDRLLVPPDDGSGLGAEEIRDEVMTLMLAGHETTAAALTWTLVLLSSHPEVRTRLEEEVDRVLAGRAATATDVERLAWTRAVIEESMRLYPPAWTIEREAVGDQRVGGIEIPDGSTVVVAPYLLHRRPDLWPDPERFDPERFLGDHQRPRHAYLPFGGGRRICVGAGFAMLEAVLVLATLAQRHRLDLVPGTEVVPLAEITLRPRDAVPMSVTCRGILGDGRQDAVIGNVHE